MVITHRGRVYVVRTLDELRDLISELYLQGIAPVDPRD
jgi:hypothetical protein